MDTNFVFPENREDEFLETLKDHLVGDPLEIRKKLRRFQLAGEPECELADYGLELLRLLGGCECKLLALRSHVLMAVVGRSEDSLSEIARNFKVCRATTSHISCKLKRHLGFQTSRTSQSETYFEQCRHRADRSNRLRLQSIE